MNPIDFIFSLFAHRLEFTEDDYQAVKERALAAYETSKAKVFFEKWWWLALLLPVLLPILRGAIDKLLDRIGDRDGDGEIDVADLALLLAEKLKKVPA